MCFHQLHLSCTWRIGPWCLRSGVPLLLCVAALSFLQDGVSFLNVPYWSDANTELYSVTLMSGPCMPPASQSFNTALSWLATAPGCNVRLVTNDTLVPTLLRDATVNTTQPLLVRLVTNVSLGVNLQQPIVFRRPVLLVGTSSTPISVDLGMAVNQLDVSAETAQLAWQAVVLENLAPGVWCWAFAGRLIPALFLVGHAFAATVGHPLQHVPTVSLIVRYACSSAEQPCLCQPLMR